MLYFEQALQLWQEGKPFFKVAQESRRAQLRAYAESIDTVEIIDAGESSCPACRALHGKKLSIKQALEEMPIPVATCTTDAGEFGQQQGWCRCDYVPVI